MNRSPLIALALAGCITPALPPQCSSNPIYSMCGRADGPRVDSCCTLTDCELRVADGHVYPCEGLDCHAAEAQLAAYCGQLCSPPDSGMDASVDAAIVDAPVDGDANDVGLDAPPCLR